ncbi:hypothetical protein SAY86_005078 [Trapa natans]|uniref:Uncharacterized protein n=1 Tax=Trapa natans TaxID=22666 RepID=A0AAN7QUJ1_TRANT|nr:hypothetical protein SAY86_005078 [Trapa natans]
MSLSQPNNLGYPVSALLESYSFDNGSKAASNAGSLLFQASKEQIRKMFHGIKLPVSPYDTAWVAMVPCTSSPQKAQFPQCVNWLLNNQLLDGSWGLPDRQHLLMKDALLSTLASILALKQWGVGERQIVRGLEFIATNSSSATDEKQHSPVGFDVILSGMINQAKYLDINIPFRQSDADTVLHRRNIDLKRCSESLSEGSKAYPSYISEGLGKSQDLEMVMKYQRKNGSILNSPSATASVLSNLQNSGCLHYINTLLEKLGDAVPAIYPMELYARLQLIENIEKLGVHHHFQDEIRSGLAETYKCWLNGEEDIFQDVACLAMAFRILRSHGYNVLPDCLSRVAEEVDFCNTLEGYLMDMGTVMELYRASQMIIYPDEIVLEKLQYWTSRILKQRLSNGSLHVDRLEKHLQEEIDLALKFPHHANLQRFVIKRSIENYNTYNTRILKSTFRNIWGKVLLNLAVEDFNMSQVVHQEELNHLTRWVVEKELDKLQFARQKLAYCYFSAAATLSAPELSDARISWTKNGVLTTVVDDFFDLGGSREELHNLITLMEKWDVDVATDCCSDNVAIIFLALRDTICETGGRATAWQGRNVTDHVKEIVRENTHLISLLSCALFS